MIQGVDSRHRPWSGTSEELEEDAFGHVVPVVSCGNGGGADLGGRSSQGGVAKIAPGGLVVRARGVGQSDFRKRDAQVVAQVAAELSIPVGFLASSAMVDMYGVESQSEI